MPTYNTTVTELRGHGAYKKGWKPYGKLVVATAPGLQGCKPVRWVAHGKRLRIIVLVQYRIEFNV